MKFFNFDEAVAAARSDRGAEFVGLRYVAPFTRLEVYVIYDPDEGDDVVVQYEGAKLFDMGGDEESYDVADVPKEAKTIFYARKSELGNGNPSILGMVSEHVLQEVLPGLKGMDGYDSEARFIQDAAEKFGSFWRQS